MLYLLKKHQLIITSIILCLLSLQLVFLNKHGIGGSILVNKTVSFVSRPIQSLTTSAYGAVKSLWNNYIYLVDLQEENKSLKNEIGLLMVENNRLLEESLSAKRIIRLLNHKEESSFHTMEAAVIGINTAGWTKTFTISKGKNEGLKKNMAVVGSRGIIGRIYAVKSHTADVLLLTDPRSRIDVIVQRTRVKGIIEGNGSKMLRLKYVRGLDDVRPGDRLISAGLGGVFPKGIVAGEILEVNDDNKFFKDITVISSMDPNTIEEVLVITDNLEGTQVAGKQQ